MAQALKKVLHFFDSQSKICTKVTKQKEDFLEEYCNMGKRQN
jgi:hypothetical protein